jgi:hypothetical protein
MKWALTLISNKVSKATFEPRNAVYQYITNQTLLIIWRLKIGHNQMFLLVLAKNIGICLPVNLDGGRASLVFEGYAIITLNSMGIIKILS